MSIFKRGKLYWYKFMWDGAMVRESTRQPNQNVARQMEAAHRASLAKGEVGIREKKTVPKLGEFCKDRLEPWAKATFEQTVHKSWTWYRTNIRIICASASLASLGLDSVHNEQVSEFAAARLKDGYAVASVNSTLRVLRRALRLAVEWGVLPSAPTIKLLSGENHREHVVTPEEEQKYLAAADPELAAFMILQFHTGLRPDEAHGLRWEEINWRNGKHGSVFVASGKTPAARRMIPMSAPLRFVLEQRWEAAGSPAEGWVWPAETKTGHFDRSTIRRRHLEAIKHAKVRPFLFYSARHTFLTRLGESGCDAWTLARIAGHSNISMSMRYVHPSELALEKAMSQLSGHNFRHNAKSNPENPNAERRLRA